MLNHVIRLQDSSPQLRIVLQMPFCLCWEILQVSVFENVISTLREKSRQAITLPAEVTAKNQSSVDRIVRENALKIYQLIKYNLHVIKTIQAKYRNTCHYFYDAALPESEIIIA